MTEEEWRWALAPMRRQMMREATQKERDGVDQYIDSIAEDVPDNNVGECGDCISRRQAVSRISDLLVLELKCERLPTWNEVYNALSDLPPVQPKQRTGRWEKVTAENRDGSISWWWACSECEKPCAKNGFGEDYFSDYCPNCGLRMEVQE